jgi:PadR family transcriptional regulator, regulatory protein PadR
LTVRTERRILCLTRLGKHFVPERVTVVPGTLDLLILRAVSLGELHGYGILTRIEQITNGALQIEQGALYPALYRLEQRKFLAGEWRVGDTNRRVKVYSLTRAGRRQLAEETDSWSAFVRAMSAALRARAAEG